MKHIMIFLLLLTILGSDRLFAQLHGKPLMDSLLKELPRQKEDTNKVKLLGKTSWEYANVNPDEGIKYALQGLVLATKLGWKKGIALANHRMGNNYFNKGDYPKSLDYFLKALKIYEEIGDKASIAVDISNVGSIYIVQSDYPKALEYLFKSIKMNEEIGNKYGLALAFSNIGNIYHAQKDFLKALEYFLKSLKLAEEIGDKHIALGANTSIAGVYGAGLINYPKALEYFLKALKISEETGDKNNMALVALNIGTVYDFQDNYTQAIAWHLKSQQLAIATGSQRIEAHAFSSIADDYINIVTHPGVNTEITDSSELPAAPYLPHVVIPKGRAALLHKAVEYLNKGIRIQKEIGQLFELQSSYKSLSYTKSLLGDYKGALEASDNYHALKDSVYSQENKEEILKMGMKNEYDRQRLTDSLKTSEKQKIAAINLKKQRSYTYMGVAGILLLVGFSFFLFKERAKSEKLLLNILPAEVAKELKTNGNAEAKLINEVTVLFTDFKGFTQLSEKLSPKELVAEINTCFSAFDNIMQKHGVEKIKTIGDAYMAAGGLPTPNKTHADDVIKAAMEIQDFMRVHKEQREAVGKLFFEIRIGVHTGPVVAGIVGIKKFAYDIWGDTVNTASRMESSGSVGKVNISETTYELVRGKFSCEYRGEVEAKGKGVMRMYYVR